MKAQKLIGWFFIVIGFVQIFQALHLHPAAGWRTSFFFTFVTSLLFIAGAVLLWRADRVHSQT